VCNEIDIAGVMDFMKQWVVKEKGPAADSRVLAFHQVFMKAIRKRGRVFETGLIGNYMLRSGEWFRKLKDLSIIDEMRLGWTCLEEAPFASKIKGLEEIRDLFNKRL
jgi:heterodisulfide reductase subunit C